MKNFWLLLLLCALIGFGIAWAINHTRYAHLEPQFGLIDYNGDVTATNVMDKVREGYVKSGARVELIGSENHNFGVMAPGEEGEHVFRVKNTGTDPLTLRIGASTCKCTIGTLIDSATGDPLESNEVPPGGETDIRIEWTVATNKTDFVQKAQVITNDPQKVVLDFTVSGYVVKDVAVSPSVWSFGDVASGEDFEIHGKVYNYYEEDVTPTNLRFASKQLTELADIQWDEFKPSEADGDHETARQGFNIHCKVKGGLRQGAMLTRFVFGFTRQDEDGNYLNLKNEVITKEKALGEELASALAQTSGRVIGSLSMIIGPKLKGGTGDGYIYEFGKLGYDDVKTAKTFVVLKGKERGKTKLSIGEVKPEGVLKAKLGKPIERETTVLFPLELEIVPGDKPYDMMGKSERSYGTIWIESDNPNVSKMLVGVKFAVEEK